jgi:hypothetical protein
MNLAALIRKALIDPKFRLALESGSVYASGQQITAAEIEAAREVLRDRKRRPGDDVLPISVLGHRDDG